ncbi:MAG: hypothetical protein DI629_03810 [Mesorhizobium amorphae]|nr:MAG: hypothetical protein DI629_03810 [Mesorhizobium amorphae]
MTLFQTRGPAVEPVLLAEAKRHLRLEHDAEDGLVAGLIRAAREDVERQTGVAMVEQGWRLVLDRWPGGGAVALKRHPVREIASVTLYGADGLPVELDAGSWEADLHSRPARLRADIPAIALKGMNGIEIDFLAGFGESGADVPDGLKRAVLLLVAHWFEFRAGYGPDAQPVSYPPAFDRLLAPFRPGRL